MRQHQKSHKLAFKCRVCPKQFTLCKGLKDHWNANHLETHGILEVAAKTNSKFLKNLFIFLTIKMVIIVVFFQTDIALNFTGPFICDECGAKRHTRATFMKHFFELHRLDQRNIRRYYDLCSKTFAEKRRVLIHIERDHLKLRPFKCNICKFKSYKKDSLNEHLLLHGTATECEICHNMVKNMKNHLKSHAKVKCPICKKFLSKYFLSRHIKTKHE